METNDYYRFQLERIYEVCPELVEPAIDELKRNRRSLDMIASENYPSLATQYACSLPLLNTKYAEGVINKRYYCGCENIDKIEGTACRLAEQLFNAEHAYVQPHSGADANLIAYNAILNKRIAEPFCKEKGVKNVDALSEEDYEDLRELWHNNILLSLDLSSGGHLTHGSRQNLSSKIFRVKHYPLNENGLIDYKAVRDIANFYKPLVLLAGYSAYPRKIDFSEMSNIAKEVGAVLMVDMAHFAGLVAGGVYTGVFNPVNYADIITSTTQKTLRGPKGGLILCTDEWASYIDKGCPGVIGGPLENQIAAKAVAFKEALSGKFKDYSHQVVKNAQALAKKLVELDVPILTGGTDNHMVIIDVRKYGITGKQAEDALAEIGITCNRNTIPVLTPIDTLQPWKTEVKGDPNGAWKTSGIRLGTPALTTLGMDEKDMEKIAVVISSVLNSALTIDENTKESSKEFARNIVDDLLSKYKVYPSLLRE